MKPASKQAGVAMFLISVGWMMSSCSHDPERAKLRYLAAGQDYMTKGQYGDAAIEFRNTLRLDPRFVDAYYELAQATLAQHDWKMAYASLEKAIELDPSRLDARLDRGRLYLAARQFDQSEEEANFILKQNSQSAAAYQLLGASMMGKRKADQAITALRKVTELWPNNSSAYVALALAEISLNRSNEAEGHFKKAVAVDPRALQAYADLADFYRLERQDAQAQQVLNNGIANNPSGTALYIESASLLAAEGDKDGAEKVLDTLRKQLPGSVDAATAIGDFYFQRKETDRALAEYRRGLSASPKNLAIQQRMQDLYLTTNQTQLAADLDRELTQDAPEDVTVRLDHGRLLMAQGRVTDAIRELQRAVADAADSPQAHYFLAMAYWQNGERGQANTALQDALKVSPGFPVALQALVRLCLAQGDEWSAQTYAQELIERFPTDPDSRQLLAGALARQGQLAQAEEQNLIAKQLAPHDAMVRLSLGQIYSGEKKWPEAQREFESALELDPHNTKALEQLAGFLTARNQTQQALLRLQLYVTRNPNDENGHIVFGVVNYQLKNYGSAQAEFERAIQLDPKSLEAYMQLSRVAEAQGQNDLAIASYQKALDLKPKSAPLATLLGNRYLANNDLPDAEKYYHQALEMDPNFAVADANLAWLDAQQGRSLDVALTMARRAKSRMPDTPSVSDTLGWILYKRGDYAGATPLFEQCVRECPDSAEYHYHFGLALLATGDKAQGKVQIEAALRMKLGSDDAQQARQAIAQSN
ncbi:MAG: tetratricopeptide repeat protein [Candidatus Acidiferrales bacterium]|jgi:tetratricopeptide (TPR) repeat protein